MSGQRGNGLTLVKAALIPAGPQSLEETEAGTATLAIHAASAAETIAKRVKDPVALEGALRAKLEAQRDFAQEYRAQFPDGGDRRSAEFQNASSGVLKEQWCMSFGFALRTVQRWCELLDPPIFASRQTGIERRCWALAEMWQAANYSSESVEWYTPDRYLAAVREVLGEIDLDPASSREANATVRAKKIFTREQDGLRKKWRGRVFMNPPYGKTSDNKSMAAEFCNKAIDEFQKGHVEACIILINSLHSQSWQAPLYEHLVCFVDHRIQFVSGDGEENKNPTFQNIFVYLGKSEQDFARVFSRLGYVMRKV